MSMGKTKLYIGGLGDRITRHDLEREFERHGHLREAWVARKPPGFGFIEFDDPRDASDAVREMDGAIIMGMKIRVEYAKKMGREPSKVAPRYSGRDSPSYSNSRRSRERYSSPDRYRSNKKYSPEDRHSNRSRRRSPSPYKGRKHRSRSEDSYEHRRGRRDKSRTRSRSRSPYDKHHSNRYSRSRSRDRKDRYSNSLSRSPPDNKNGEDNSPLIKRRSPSMSD